MQRALQTIFLGSLKTVQFMDPLSLLRCPAVRANETEQSMATNRFSKSCELLLCSESILGFIESEVVGMGS